MAMNQSPSRNDAELRIAEDAINMFLEYRDKHGHDEDSAKANALNEFAEAQSAVSETGQNAAPQGTGEQAHPLVAGIVGEDDAPAVAAPGNVERRSTDKPSRLVRELHLHAALMITPEVKPAVRKVLSDAVTLMMEAAEVLERVQSGISATPPTVAAKLLSVAAEIEARFPADARQMRDLAEILE